MTAPNTETTVLTRNLGDGNPDGLLMQGVKVTTLAATGAQTLTAANMVNGVFIIGQTANLTATTDTYANLANQVGSTLRPVPANTFFTFTITSNSSTANTAVTIAGGTGVTINGNANLGTLAALAPSATYMAVFTANSTVVCYRM